MASTCSAGGLNDLGHLLTRESPAVHRLNVGRKLHKASANRVERLERLLAQETFDLGVVLPGPTPEHVEYLLQSLRVIVFGTPPQPVPLFLCRLTVNQTLDCDVPSYELSSPDECQELPNPTGGPSSGVDRLHRNEGSSCERHVDSFHRKVEGDCHACVSSLVDSRLP